MDKVSWFSRKPDYEKAYNTLMEYWDSLPDEEKATIGKQLDEAGL